MATTVYPTTASPDEPDWLRDNAPPMEFGASASTGVVKAAPMALSAQGETASTAAAVQAKTQVEARYMMAMHNPRSLMQFRQRLLDACKRPRFAQTARRYMQAMPKEALPVSLFQT